MTVWVEAAARLHFGVLDLRASRGRWFGGIGAAAPGPTLLVSASAADQLQVSGQDAARAERFARRFLEHHGAPMTGCVRVHRALPSHAGLGSGTQLALAVGRALAELHGLPVDAAAVARATGRGRRSAVGTWTFAGGGLVVEGGRRPDREDAGPLLARLPFPPEWRCVVAVPHERSGLSGEMETTAMAELPAPPPGEAERVAHVVLMGLLPALVEADPAAFGAAVSEIQQVTGRWFAPIQGGTFAPGITAALVREMSASGAVGVGQSSWGPTVYGVVEGDAAAERLAEHVRRFLPGAVEVHAGPFRSTGASVWRGSDGGQTPPGSDPHPPGSDPGGV